MYSITVLAFQHAALWIYTLKRLNRDPKKMEKSSNMTKSFNAEGGGKVAVLYKFKKNRLLKCHYNFGLLPCWGEANDLAAAPDKTTEGVCGLMRTHNIPRSSAQKQTT